MSEEENQNIPEEDVDNTTEIVDDAMKRLDALKAKLVVDHTEKLLNTPEVKNAPLETQLQIIEKYQEKIARQSNHRQMNTLKRKVATPMGVKMIGFIGMELPEDDILPDAFPHYTTENFLTLIQKQQQVTDPNSPEAAEIKDIFAVKTTRFKNERIHHKDEKVANAFVVKVIQNNMERELTSEEETRWNELLENIQKLGDNHYKIIAALSMTHAFTKPIHKLYGDKEILQFKKRIETITFKYNMHNPTSCIRLEENQLRNLRSIEGVFLQFHDYLDKKIRAGLVPSMANSSIDAITNTPPTLNSSVVVNQSQAVATSSKSSTSTKEVSTKGDISNITIVPNPTKDYTAEDQVKDVMSVREYKLPIVIDLKNPLVTLDSLMNYILQALDVGLNLTDILLNLGKQINYNVYTNEWGAYAIRDSNFTYLEAVRKMVYECYGREFKSNKLLTPRLYFKYYYRWYSFVGDMGYSDKNVYTVNLMPGESTEIYQKTTETTRTSRENTKNVLDSTSKEVTDSIKNSLEKSKSNTESVASEHTDYIDSQVEASIDYNSPCVSAGASANCNWGATNSLQQLNESVSNVVNNAVAENITQSNSKSDISFSEVTKEEKERTEEGGSRREFRNVNTSAGLTNSFKELIQMYESFRALYDIKIVFSNGMNVYEFPYSELNQQMDKFLKPESKLREQIFERAKELATIPDYKNREILLYEEIKSDKNEKNDSSQKQSKIRIRKDIYSELLAKANVEYTNPQDLEFMEYFEHITGVMVEHQTYSKPTAGVAGYPMLSPGDCLDKYQAPILMAQVNRETGCAKKALAEAEKVLWEAKILKYRAVFMRKIVKTDSLPALSERTDSIFKLGVAAKKDVVDQTFVGSLSGLTLPNKKKGFQL